MEEVLYTQISANVKLLSSALNAVCLTNVWQRFSGSLCCTERGHLGQVGLKPPRLPSCDGEASSGGVLPWQGEVQALFLRHEGYLGAIGAFLKGAEQDSE